MTKYRRLCFHGPGAGVRCKGLLGHLASNSVWFEFAPMPDGTYEVTVKRDCPERLLPVRPQEGLREVAP